jgi:Zn-dependent M28 family amino/carboxypeptidase
MIRVTSLFVLVPAMLFAQTTPPASVHDAFNARQAYAYTAQVAAFGVRWPGSAGHTKTEDLIKATIRRDGGVIETDDFTATTPRGPVPVHNIIGKFNVTANPAQPIFILAGHYDTLFKPGFIGANDGASSTAILLAFGDALAAGLKSHPLKMQVWLVWTDLEEAIQSFQGDDGLYGSRHLAQKLKAGGLVPRVKGFFLLDMIGDKGLGVTRETRSTAWLQDFIAQAAKTLGYSQYFFHDSIEIIDDHVSFLDVGIPSVDVVDAQYGRMLPNGDGMGEFHHSNADTMDKVSQTSLEIVGRTVLLAVELIDGRM